MMYNDLQDNTAHDPLFSIVIPTYNRGDRIFDAIDSILQQSFSDFEIIIVDDGSTDNTREIVGTILDGRIRYFKKDNEERSIARNFGIQKATGKYINFLDSDDKFYSHHLQAAYDLLERLGHPEIVHLGFEVINENGTVLSKHADLDEHLVDRMIDENVLSCNVIFVMREILLVHSFPNYRGAVISEDWCLFLKLVSRYKVYYNNIVTTAVVEHSQRSLRNIDSDRLVISTEIIVTELKNDDVFLKKYRAKVNYFFANQYTYVALIMALTKHRRKDTLRYLYKSMCYDPAVIFRRRFLASLKHWI